MEFRELVIGFALYVVTVLFYIGVLVYVAGGTTWN